MTPSRRSVLAFLASAWPAATASASVAPQALPPTRAVTPPIAPLTAYNAVFLAGGNAWTIGDAVYLTTSYVGAAGETPHGPISNTVIAAEENPVLNPGFVAPIAATVFASPEAAVTGIRVYLNINGTWRGYHQIPNSTTAVYVSTNGTPGTPTPAGTPCFVCGSLDLRDLDLNVTGITVDADHARTIVRRDLPIEQYCGNCGTKRINRWAL